MNFTWISSAISTLTTQYSGLFRSEGVSWLHWLGIIILTVYALKWTLVSVSGQGGYDLPGVVQFFAMFTIASFMLTYYNQPLPWCDSTIASVIPDTADKLAEVMNSKALSTLAGKFKATRDSIPDPPSFISNMAAGVVWLECIFFMFFAQAIMFAVNIIGYLALGVLTMMGPIMIPFFIVPRLSWIFWNWVQAVLEFAFWRVISTAIVFVWATAWGSFMDNAFHGNYSIAHLSELVPYMMAMTLAMVWSLFFLPARLTSDLFKGTATAGANWATGVALAIRAVV